MIIKRHKPIIIFDSKERRFGFTPSTFRVRFNLITKEYELSWGIFRQIFFSEEELEDMLRELKKINKEAKE